jgi:N-acetylmuramoyl-L-alanine amidase
VSQRLSQVLKEAGIAVTMTRQNSSALGSTKDQDMNERARLISVSTASLLISIHMNSFPSDSSVWGPQVFYQAGSREGEKLANKIQQELNEATGGKRQAASNDLMVLRAGKAPAVLVECGFISNPQEEQKLGTEDYQLLIAQAIARGIKEYRS